MATTTASLDHFIGDNLRELRQKRETRSHCAGGARSMPGGGLHAFGAIREVRARIERKGLRKIFLPAKTLRSYT